MLPGTAGLAEKVDADITLLHVTLPLPSSVARYIERDCNCPDEGPDPVKNKLMDETVREGEKLLTKLKWDLVRRE
ncbi:hypothetical protein [Desulfofalx alkaliphila]|uniref:hypothetical protein n=1 Tax=Desulfofalx alkaliphila TaxID=105483 RepID=UPI00068F663A|nr:hypothetical protein [Desulfofalx alkaliphila]